MMTRTLASDHPVRDRRGPNPPKITECARADPGARQHRHRQLGHHAHVDRHHIALLDAHRLERVGQLAFLRCKSRYVNALISGSCAYLSSRAWVAQSIGPTGSPRSPRHTTSRPARANATSGIHRALPARGAGPRSCSIALSSASSRSTRLCPPAVPAARASFAIPSARARTTAFAAQGRGGWMDFVSCFEMRRAKFETVPHRPVLSSRPRSEPGSTADRRW
jgi:hypothetical protein